MITSNETDLKVSIANLVIYKGLYFNISQKPRFKKVVDLENIVSECYQPPNKRFISKDILDVISDIKWKET